MSEPIDRDENRFRYLSNEPLAVIPEGTSTPLEFKTTHEMMAERDAWLAETEICRCCGGLGRTPLAKTASQS